MATRQRIHEFVTPQRRGLIALPPSVRRHLHLDEPGAQVEFIELADGRIEVRGVLPVPADQAWFWTERWQRREHEVDQHAAAGAVQTFSSADEFLDSLDD